MGGFSKPRPAEKGCNMIRVRGHVLRPYCGAPKSTTSNTKQRFLGEYPRVHSPRRCGKSHANPGVPVWNMIFKWWLLHTLIYRRVFHIREMGLANPKSWWCLNQVWFLSWHYHITTLVMVAKTFFHSLLYISLSLCVDACAFQMMKVAAFWRQKQ